jgi:hypothetical protein
VNSVPTRNMVICRCAWRRSGGRGVSLEKEKVVSSKA